MMAAKWEKLEGNEGILTVEVDAERFKKDLIKHLKRL